MIAAALICSGAFAAPNPLIIDGARPRSIILSQPGKLPTDADLAKPPMVRRLSGVIAKLERQNIAEFFRAIAPARNAAVASQHDGQHMLHVRLNGVRTARAATIVRDVSGAMSLTTESDGAVALDPLRFFASLDIDALYSGDFRRPDDDPSRAELFNLASNTRVIELDPTTLRTRLFRAAPAMTRINSLATLGAPLTARLPRNYDPRTPPGLVIWITPTDGWAVPRPLHDALDAHNCIAIGALASGNDKPVNDRIQLALDATATALARWPIDTRRIYLVGMSGGGKIAMLLWAGWPEVYSGCVPIVGMLSYDSAPAGPGKTYPASFSKPVAIQWNNLRADRLAAISGPPDFNFDSMSRFARGLERDGLAVRLFEYAEMGHTMPEPLHFAEALSWIDEPYQQLRATETQAARAAFAAYTSQYTERAPTTDEEREALEEVTRVGPWTKPAWRACELLGVAPTSK